MLDKTIYENITSSEKTEILKKEALDLISKTNFSEYKVEFKEVVNFDTMEVHICVYYNNYLPVDMQLLFSNNTAKIGVQYESDEIMYFGRWICTVSINQFLYRNQEPISKFEVGFLISELAFRF